MTSGGNRNPANPETGGWMDRMRRRRFTPTASFTHGRGTNPNGSRQVRAQCNSALPTQPRRKPRWTTWMGLSTPAGLDRVVGAIRSVRGDQAVVAVIAPVEDIAPAGRRVGEEDVPFSAGVEVLDGLVQGEDGGGRGGHLHPCRDEPQIGVGGVHPSQPVRAVLKPLDHAVGATGDVPEEVEVVIELLHVEHGLIGDELTESERLVADELAILHWPVEVRGPRRRQVAVPPLPRPGDGLPTMDPLAVRGAVWGPVTQPADEQIDRLWHRVRGHVCTNQVTVHVARDLCNGRARPSGVRLPRELHPCAEHRLLESPHPPEARPPGAP